MNVTCATDIYGTIKQTINRSTPKKKKKKNNKQNRSKNKSGGLKIVNWLSSMHFFLTWTLAFWT